MNNQHLESEGLRGLRLAGERLRIANLISALEIGLVSLENELDQADSELENLAQQLRELETKR